MPARQTPRDYYEHLLATMPAGAERTVLRVLSFHVGLANAIQKPDLIDACKQSGTHFSNERQIRLSIVNLRKAHVPVCASSGDSGYYLPASLEEYTEFYTREYLKKISDMRETVKAMNQAIPDLFPSEYQQYKINQAARAGQPALL